LRIKKNILSKEQSEDAMPFLDSGGSRPKAVEGGCFPLQSLLYLSRNEKLSRNNKKLLCSDGRNCPEVFLDIILTHTIIRKEALFHFRIF